MEKKNDTKKKPVKKKVSTRTKSKIVVEKKKGFNSYETVLLAFGTLVIGFVIGLAVALSAGKYKVKDNVVTEAYNKLLNNKYANLTEEKLTDAAINGMLSATDEYSSYIKDSSYVEDINGYYNGIGISIGRGDDGKVYVYEVFNDGPSFGKLKEADVVVSFNDMKTEDYTVEELSTHVKGLPINTVVKTKVLRDNESLEFDIPVNTITIRTVTDFRLINDKYGYLKLDYISSNSYSQVKDTLEFFNNNNVKNMILDLRCNTGGDVNGLKNIASLFLNNNSIIYKEVMDGKTTEVHSSGAPIYNGKVIVLINNTTASAAEILAATLKDNNNAKLIGIPTYGKYTIQTTYTLSNDSIIKYSVGEWLRKNGSSVKDVGVIPDIFIANTEDADVQYDTAVKELEKD